MTRNFAQTIAGYYLADAKPGGGGTNVVNVILVDFRGFDTFGEIIVLGIAALAIFALLDTALRGAAARRLARNAPSREAARRAPAAAGRGRRGFCCRWRSRSAIYIFLRGHNMPGGGFIAGLVIAIALIMQYMASGYAWADQQRADRRPGDDRRRRADRRAHRASPPGISGRPFLTSALRPFPPAADRRHRVRHRPWLSISACS